MYLRSLELMNFRNFRRAAVELAEGPTVILGDNGQGKSNLLEAIELLATAKSARAGSDRELIHWAALSGAADVLPEQFARIRAAVLRNDHETRAEVLIRPLAGDGDGPAASKTFRLNGVARRALEFVGAINVVAFSPLDVALVAGPPAGRRRYLDVMISQFNSRYLYGLQRYQKVLLQRNHLLKQLKGRRAEESGLSVWSEQLVAEGAFLILERARAVRDLTGLADRWFRGLGGGGGQLEVLYRPALGPAGSVVGESTRSQPIPLPSAALRPGPDGEGALTLATVQHVFSEEAARVQQREVAIGMSLAGPHRDDLRFVLDGVDLQVYGSRGQQRLAALALKLAEADLLEQRAGSRPILLMDDVLSELDRRRQLAVLRFAARTGQTLLTVTSIDVVDPDELPNAVVLRVQAGTVIGNEE